jgi:cysteine synthase
VLPEANSYLHQIRPTPLVRVSLGDGQPGGAGCDTAEPGIWCKLEFLNPSGSTKDRIARHILEKAWRQGQLSAGDTVAEASSGSTSIAFALACSQIPGGTVDAVVSGVGTGGTLRGLYEAFAGAGCPVSAHAAIPRDLALFGANAECCSLRFSSDVPGVVVGLSEIYAQWQCDRLREWEISDRDCLELTRKLWGLGFPVGPSSGLNFAAALGVAAALGSDAQMVTVFPDRMERYFSHKVFEEIRNRS